MLAALNFYLPLAFDTKICFSKTFLMVCVIAFPWYQSLFMEHCLSLAPHAWLSKTYPSTTSSRAPALTGQRVRVPLLV